MTEFYFAVTRDLASTADVAKALPLSGLSRPKILLSAGSFWRKRLGFVIPQIPESVSDVLVDSGAQQFFTKFQLEYPYDTERYLKFASALRPRFVASLDLPLDILIKRGVSPRDAVKKTVDNIDRFLYLLPDQCPSAIPLPVIQGLSIADYRYCLELCRKGDLLDKSEWWGIGSVCMASTPHVIRVCRYIRSALPHKKLHAFGPTIGSWPELWGLVDSIDTGLYGMAARYGRARVFAAKLLYEVAKPPKGRKIPSHVLMAISLRAFQDYADFLTASAQPKLEQFMEAV